MNHLIKKNVLRFLLVGCLGILSLSVNAQNNVGINIDPPDPSATLHIGGTTGGLLVPRLSTSQRNAITNPANGLIVYDTDLNTFIYNSGTTTQPSWKTFLNSFGTIADGQILVGSGGQLVPRTIGGALTLDSQGNFTLQNNAITVNSLPNSGVTAGTYGNSASTPVLSIDEKGRITGINLLPISGLTSGGGGGTPPPPAPTFVPATGDITGTYPALTIANAAVTTAKIASTGNDQVLTTDAGGVVTWIAKTALGTPALPSAQIFVGNAANTATAVALSGDATIDNAGALTIGTGAVNSAKILDNTIVDIDVNAAAAIAGTKINPNFGAQNISTTGKATSAPTVLADPTNTLTTKDYVDASGLNFVRRDGTTPLTANWTVGAFDINSTGALNSTTLTTTGAGTIGGALGVTGATTLTGNLTGNGTNTFNGNTSISGTNTFTVGTGATTLGGTLGVTGNTTLGGTLGVTGLTTLSNTNGLQFGAGQMANAVVTTVSAASTNNELPTALAVNNTLGNFVRRDGTTPLTANWTVGAFDINSTGALNSTTLTTTGAGTIGGALGVTGATTLTGNLTGNGTNTFNGNTSISGTNTFTVGTGATTLGGTLGVTGLTTLSNTNGLQFGAGQMANAIVTTVSAASTNNELPTALAVNNTLGNFVRRDGTTPLTANWTVGAFDINSTGALNSTTLTTTGAGTIGGTLGVTGATTLTGNLTGNGTNTFNGNTSISGTNTFTVGTGATTLGGTLGVTGNTTLGGTLGVIGLTTLSNTNGLQFGAGQMANAIVTTVSAASTNNELPTALAVNNTLGNFVRRDGTTPLTANWTVGAFDINSTGALNSTTLTTTGAGTIGGALGVTGATTLTGNLTGNGTNTFNGNTSISGTNTFTVGTGATTLGGTLGVTGNTTLGGTLGVTGLTTLSNTNGLQFGAGQMANAIVTTVSAASTNNELPTALAVNNTLGNFVRRDGTTPLTANWTVGAFDINSTGALNSTTLTTTGAGTIGGALGVTGATTLTGNLTGNGTNTFNGNTSISGTNTFTVGTGATTLGGTLGVTGNTTLGGTLGVTGLTTLSNTNGLQFGAGQMANAIVTTVSAASTNNELPTALAVNNTLGGFIRRDGTTPLTAAWNVGGFNITNIAALNATGATTLGGTLGVIGATSTTGITNTGNIANSGSFSTATASVTGALNVGGLAQFNAGITMNGGTLLNAANILLNGYLEAPDITGGANVQAQHFVKILRPIGTATNIAIPTELAVRTAINNATFSSSQVENGLSVGGTGRLRLGGTLLNNSTTDIVNLGTSTLRIRTPGSTGNNYSFDQALFEVGDVANGVIVDTYLNGSLTTASPVTLSTPAATLNVGGTLTVAGVTTFNNNVNITTTRTLTLGTGAVNLGTGALTIGGATTVNANMTFGPARNLTVGTGATTLGGTLGVTGATTLTGALTANGGILAGSQRIQNVLDPTAAQDAATKSYVDARALPTMTDAQIIVSNLTVPTARTMSGDATISNTGALTIGNAAVTSKLLTGYTVGANTAIAATDNILQSFGKAQGQIDAINATTHAAVTLGTANGLSLIAQSLSLATANGTTTGALTGADWTTFNNKQNALTLGNATTTTTGVTIGGGAGSIIGAGLTIDIQNATTAQNGLLTSTDWNTFNNKLGNTLTSTNILVGSAGNLATPVAMSGDATLSNTGALTISPAVVTAAKIASTGNDLVLTTDAGGVVSWIPKAALGTPALPSAQILVGNAANNAAAVALSGDATISNTGALTIANNVVTTAKILDGTILPADLSFTPLTNTLTSTNILVGSAGNLATPVTLSGDATLSNTGVLTIADAAVTGKLLTGYTVGANTAIVATDNILQSFGKTQGQINALNTTAHAAVTLGTANGLSLIAQSLSLATANGTTTGALTGADWTTFNNKQNALTLGNATTTTAGVTIGGGTGSIIGAGLTVDIQNATTAQNGLLTSADWNTFNNKLGNTLTSTNILVGSAGNLATPVTMSGDATLSNTGALTIANNAVTTAKILDGTILPADLSFTPLTNTLTSANILVGSAGNLATPVTMSGDATLSNTGALTIANNAVTTAKILDGTILPADLSFTPLTNTLTSANILVGSAGNLATPVTMSGDATLSNTGALTIINDAITTAKIANNAVTTTKIADTNVTLAKLELGTTANQFIVTNGTNIPTYTTKNTIPLSGFAIPTAAVSMGTQRIIAVGAPTAPTDAANRAYVDAAIGGIGGGDGILISNTGVISAVPATANALFRGNAAGTSLQPSNITDNGALINLGSNTSVSGTNTFTVGTGATTLGGTLGVAGATTLTGALTTNGGILAGSQRIQNVLDPTALQDAATKNYVDALGAGFVRTNGTTPLTANWTVGAFNITSTAALNSATLTTTGAGTIGGAFVGNGTNTFNGNTAVSGTNTFTVGTGATTLGGTLGVTGATTLTGALTTNGGILAGSQRIQNVLDPTALQDAATKNYVDALGAGFVRTNGTTPLTANWTVGAFDINSTGALNSTTLTTTGAGTIGGTLGVTGATTLTGALTTNGTNTFNGTTSVSGTNTFSVGTGATTLGGALGVTGATTLTGALTTNGGILAGSQRIQNVLDPTALQDAATKNYVDALGAGFVRTNGTTPLTANWTVGAFDINSTGALNSTTLTTTGAGTIGGTLGVTGATTLNGNTAVSGTNTFSVGTGATTLGGTLGVTGATTLTGALTANGGILAGSQRIQNVLDPTALQDAATKNYVDALGAGFVRTNGTTPLTANWTVGAFNITSTAALNSATLTTTGAATIGGALGVTGATTLGGNTTISGANSFTVGTGSTTLGGTLGVTGLATLSNTNGLQFGAGQMANAIVTTISGASTDNQLPTALAVNTVLNTTLGGFVRRDGTTPLTANWTVGAFDINSTGALNSTTLTTTGAGTIGGALGVTGATTLTGALVGNGTNTFNGNTAVSGANTFTVGTGATTLGGTLGVTGATTLTGALAGNGTNTFNGATSVTGTNTFTVGTGATTLGGTLGVTGATTLTGALTANGGILAGSQRIQNVLDPTALQDAATKNYVDALGAGFVRTNGTTPLTANWTVGAFDINSTGALNSTTLTTTGAATIGGTLGVTGATTLNGNTAVSGTNTFSVGTGATALGGALGVTGAITANALNAGGIVKAAAGTGLLSVGTIVAADIATGAVTTTQILDGTILDADISGVTGAKVTGNIAGNAANVTGTVAIANGGTGATTAPLARTALGLGTGDSPTFNGLTVSTATTSTNGISNTGAIATATLSTTGVANVNSLTITNKGTSASTVGGDGGTTLVTKDYVDALTGGTITATNGLSKTGGNITLGGALTGNTTIGTGANSLSINTSSFAVTPATTFTSGVSVGGGLVASSTLNVVGNTNLAAATMTTLNIGAVGINQILTAVGPAGDDVTLVTEKAVRDAIIASAPTVSEGLSYAGNDIQLGGTLTADRTISTGTNSLVVNATGGALQVADGLFRVTNGGANVFAVDAVAGSVNINNAVFNVTGGITNTNGIINAGALSTTGATTLTALNAGGIVKAAATTGLLSVGAIAAADIGTGAVTTTQILDGTILDADISGVTGAKVTGNIAGNAANVTGTVAIANGGTGATTAPLARTALGLGTLATLSAVTTTEITDGTIVDADISGVTGAKVTGNIAGNAANVTGTVAIANGGTGATTAPLARTALGLGTLATLSAVTTTEITDGTIVDADISGVTGAKVTGNIAGNAANVTGTVSIANGGTGATTDVAARTNLGLGTLATLSAVTSAEITNGTIVDADISGVTGAKVTGDIAGNAANVTGTVAIANGGTGATTAPLARTALGLGTLATLSAVTTTEITDGTIVDADISGVTGAKVTGNIAGNAANVTGTVAIANGGTGATTAPLARTALGLGTADSPTFNGLTVTPFGLGVVKSSVAGVLSSGTIAAADISTGAVTTTQILDATIATADIANLAIDNTKLAADAVTTTQILDGTIATVDMANLAVDNTKLAADAVTTAKILDGTILDADINATAAIAGSKITPTFSANVLPDADNTRSLGVIASRWTEVFATNGTINTSDRRLKKNIKDINYGLTDVMKLRPVSYEWIKGSSGTKLGLIAQELQEVIGEVVHVGDDKEKSLGVYYADLVPVLIKAIQEQQKQIDLLSNKVSTLNTENSVLKAQATDIEQLKTQMQASQKQLNMLMQLMQQQTSTVTDSKVSDK